MAAVGSTLRALGFAKRPQSRRKVDEQKVDALIEARNAARKAKDFKEADRIRDELNAMGVELEDAKDGTKWKVKAMSATAHPTIAMRPMLPADVPLLAEIFRASIEELAADDYSESQREAWAATADDEAAFGERLAKQLTLVGTMEGSPVGFASLKAPDVIDMLYVHPAAGANGVATMLVNALEKLAAARGAGRLTADVSDSRGRLLRQARIRAADPQHAQARRANGSPTPRWKRNWPRRRRRHEQARHAVPEALALLHRPQIRRDRRGGAHHPLHDLQADLTTRAHHVKRKFPTRNHKIAIAVIALVTAFALLSNYYLW